MMHNVNLIKQSKSLLQNLQQNMSHPVEGVLGYGTQEIIKIVEPVHARLRCGECNIFDRFILISSPVVCCLSSIAVFSSI